MTVIHLGSTGFPRGQEIVSTPEILIGSSNRDPIHTEFPVYTTSRGIGESDTSRAAYSSWKQQYGIAGLTVGNTQLSNTQIGITLAGAIAGFFAGQKYLGGRGYGAISAIIGALIAYYISTKYVK